LKEIELVDAFCEFLNKEGYEFKRELRYGSYHNEGYCDIVVKSKLFENMIVGIEAKINGFQAVLSQACSASYYFAFGYILYPKLPSKKSLEKLKKYSSSPGLIIPKEESLNEFYIYAKPIVNFRYFKNNEYGSKIWRNWNQNRCGRRIHASELPEGYDPEKAEALEDDYKWRYIQEEKKRKFKLNNFQIEKIESKNKKLTDFIKEMN